MRLTQIEKAVLDALAKLEAPGDRRHFTCAEIAEVTGTHANGVSRTLGSLKRKGLVERHVATSKTVRFALTDKARRS